MDTNQFHDLFEMKPERFKCTEKIYELQNETFEKSIDSENQNKKVIIHKLSMNAFQTQDLFEFSKFLFTFFLNQKNNPNASKFILPFYGFASTFSHFIIVYEDVGAIQISPFSGSNEMKRLQNDNEKVRMLFQIADAVSYIHSLGGAHLRIKPSSIFFDEKNDNYLIGYFTPPSIINIEDEDQDLPFFKQKLWTRDSFMFGILIYELFLNTDKESPLVFKRQSDIMKIFWEFKEFPKDSPILELASKCIVNDPELRPPFPEIVSSLAEILKINKTNTEYKPTTFSEKEMVHLIMQLKNAPFFQLLTGFIYSQMKNDQEALNAYRKPPLDNNANALNNIAVLLYRMKNRESLANSLKFMKKAADLGFAVSQRNYSVALLNGVGVDKDIDESLKYLTLSANQGYIEANFGMFYELVSKEDPQCSKYLRNAAKKTHPCALHMYGLAIETGLGFEGDKSLNFFKLGADNHYPECLNNYATRINDIALSNKFWKEAAETGLRHAQYNYGVSLLMGRGVEPNREEGIRLIKLASDQHYPNAMFDYAIILRDNAKTPEELEEADKLCIEASNISTCNLVVSTNTKKSYSRIHQKYLEMMAEAE